jgi:hypothetical protein
MVKDCLRIAYTLGQRVTLKLPEGVARARTAFSSPSRAMGGIGGLVLVTGYDLATVGLPWTARSKTLEPFVGVPPDMQFGAVDQSAIDIDPPYAVV